jgi:hypothetical protein
MPRTDPPAQGPSSDLVTNRELLLLLTLGQDQDSTMSMRPKCTPTKDVQLVKKQTKKTSVMTTLGLVPMIPSPNGLCQVLRLGKPKEEEKDKVWVLDLEPTTMGTNQKDQPRLK